MDEGRRVYVYKFEKYGTVRDKYGGPYEGTICLDEFISNNLFWIYSVFVICFQFGVDIFGLSGDIFDFNGSG